MKLQIRDAALVVLGIAAALVAQWVFSAFDDGIIEAREFRVINDTGDFVGAFKESGSGAVLWMGGERESNFGRATVLLSGNRFTGAALIRDNDLSQPTHGEPSSAVSLKLTPVGICVMPDWAEAIDREIWWGMTGAEMQSVSPR